MTTRPHRGDMKTLVRYTQEGAVYVRNGEYTLQPFDKKKELKSCKHGTIEAGSAPAMIFTNDTTNDRRVYCMTCVMDLLDREVGRID